MSYHKVIKDFFHKICKKILAEKYLDLLQEEENIKSARITIVR